MRQQRTHRDGVRAKQRGSDATRRERDRGSLGEVESCRSSFLAPSVRPNLLSLSLSLSFFRAPHYAPFNGRARLFAEPAYIRDFTKPRQAETCHEGAKE